MSIFNRIGNLAKGVWIQNTRPNAPDPVHEAALERELDETRRATPQPPRVQAPLPGALRSAPQGAEPVSPSPASPGSAKEPIELDGDGAVKRTL